MKGHLYLLVFFFFFLACTKQKKKFEFSGGTITLALENEPTTYIPRNVFDYYSATVLSQIYEGLVGLDPKTLKIVPRIAEKWEVSEDGLEYTFTIRKDILFHPHKGFSNKKDRLLTLEDVVFSFEKACSKNKDLSEPASYNMIFKNVIGGAEVFFEGKAGKLKGVTTEGNNKIKIKLKQRDNNFIYKLTGVTVNIISKKQFEKGFEHELIGTGPFMFSDYNKKTDSPKIILVKNKDYYLNDENGNSLPYLDSVVFIFQPSKMEQLNVFEEGGIDMIIGLPTSRIAKMLEERIEDFNSKPPKLILQNNPQLSSVYYAFDMRDKRFKNPLVRKAFNYAVNKKTIGHTVLKNQYNELGYWGIVPPVPKALRGYDFDKIKEHGYSFNPEKARKLLAKAGYPNGKGFGTVTLRYNISDIHSAVADEFSKQIFSVLNINVNIDGSTFEKLLEDDAIGKGDIFRRGWSADFPSPETFLHNFYGKLIPEDSLAPSLVNQSRYNNPIFDEFFERAKKSNKKAEQMKWFTRAEIELLKDPPVIPLWYLGDIQITKANIRQLYFNALGLFDFRKVYLKEWTLEEYKKTYKIARK